MSKRKVMAIVKIYREEKIEVEMEVDEIDFDYLECLGEVKEKIKNKIVLKDPNEKMEIHIHDCMEDDKIEKIDSDQNIVYWSYPHSRESYQSYRCTICGKKWGCRHQWDAGTGSDDRWEELK